jgi:hypothetical protein
MVKRVKNPTIVPLLYYHVCKISQQPENCENRNDLDLVQAFLKTWWIESDFKAPNFPLSLRFKVFGCRYNSIYNNTRKGYFLKCKNLPGVSTSNVKAQTIKTK